MSIVFMEGFDVWDSGQVSDRWTYASSGCNPAVNYSRWAEGKGILLGSTNYMYKQFSSNYVTLVFGGAYYFTGSGYGTNNTQIRFYDGSTCQVACGFDAVSNHLKVWRGVGTTLLGEVTSIDMDNYIEKWFYLEFKAVINGSTGLIHVKIDEQTVLYLTNQNTQESSNAYANRLHLQAGTEYVDDIYLDDNDFIGECRVKTFFPTSDGTLSDFTANTGNKYAAVDEIGPDEDTTYVYSNVANDQQTFKITPGALPQTIKALQINNCLRKDDVGYTTVKNIIRQNGSVYYETNEYDCPSNYVHHYSLFLTDPDDSQPWTQTKLEDAEFGMEIITIP